jgi:hypothetical protein
MSANFSLLTIIDQGGKPKKVDTDRKEAEASEVRPLMDGDEDEDDLEKKSDDIELGLIPSSTENPMHDMVDKFPPQK